MAMVPINWNPTDRELRWFAGLLLPFFAGVAGFWGAKSGQTTGPVILASVAAVLALIGLAAPRAIRWMYVSWMVAVWPIGWVVSHVVLAVIFFGVFTPIGLVLRMLGRDPMPKSFDRSAKTYWISRSQNEPKPSQYFRQF